MAERGAERNRRTAETELTARIILDGRGEAEVSTGIGFLDHLVAQFAKHGLFDLRLEGRGDVAVDAHHLVEDAGQLLGTVVADALGDRAGVNRYGSSLVPMDEALLQAVVDLSGRPLTVISGAFPPGRPGGVDGEVWPEFFRAFARGAALTLHLRVLAGENAHHTFEAAFKAFGRALAEAVALNPRVRGVPSTKGVLG